MNTTKRSAARAGLVVCSGLALALTGCRTQVVHAPSRTVYVPAPPPVVYSPPPPAPPPPPVVVVPPPVLPSVVVIQSANDFYEPLAAYGRWEVVGAYGRCWIPARVEAGWRPYSNGYWQRTDAGWYWASEEPWGWATYHYGRWDFHARFGWLWVPQTQWAPAWVAWREGGGYVGWAPLRPSVAIGVSLGAVHYEPAFASRAFVFVEHRRMLEPVRPKTVIVNNTTIINQTVNLTNVKGVNKTVINEGPRPEVIERETGRKVRTVPVQEFRHQEETTVAARERKIPTASRRITPPPARTEPQPAELKTALPPVSPRVERPAQVVTQPASPRVAPARPMPPRAENLKHTATTLPRVTPEPRNEVRPEQTVRPRGDVRPVVKPVVGVQPMLLNATTSPGRDEKRRETVIEKRNPATPPTQEPKPTNTIRPESRPQTKPPVNAETAPPYAFKRQTRPPTERPADKRLIPQKKNPSLSEARC